MKKFLLGLATIAFVPMMTAQTNTSETPSGFYIGVNAGYNMPMSPRNVGFFGWNTWREGLVNFTRPNSGPDKFDDVPLSLGKGINFGMSIGYMFTENLGAELGANYLLGAETKSLQRNESGTDIIDQKISGKMVQLSPTFVLKGNYSQLNPYAKLGLVFGLGTKVTYEENEIFNNQPYDFIQVADGGTPVGFTGAIGMDYNLKPNLSLFGELKAVSLSYSPQKAHVTKYTENGVDKLPTMTVRNKETEFLDSYTQSTANTEPWRANRINLPFSSIGLNIGVKYNF